MAAKLIAIEPVEGKAFYSEDGRFFLLRPLYSANGAINVSEEVAKLAIQREGYKEVKNGGREFLNVKDIISYVQDQYVYAKEGQPLHIPNKEILDTAVLEAEDSAFLSFVDKANSEWIPQGQIAKAKILLDDLLSLTNIQNRPELSLAAQELKLKIKEIETRVPVVIMPETNKKWYHNIFIFIKGYTKSNNGIDIQVWQAQFPELYRKHPDFGNELMTFFIKKRLQRDSPFNMVG